MFLNVYNYLKSSISFHWFVLDSRSGIGVFMANALIHRLHGTTTSNHSVAQTSLSIRWKDTTNLCKAQTSWIFHVIYSEWSAMAWSEDNLQKNRVHPRDQTQIGGLGDMHLHPPNHLAVLEVFRPCFLMLLPSLPPYSMVSFPLIKCLSSFPSFRFREFFHWREESITYYWKTRRATHETQWVAELVGIRPQVDQK